MTCLECTHPFFCLDLGEFWLHGSPVRISNPCRPVVAEPERWKQMQIGRLRSAVGGSDFHQDVIRTGFGVFDKHVEIAVLIEDPRVQEFILHLLP